MCVCLLFLKKNLKKREKITQPMGRHSCMRIDKLIIKCVGTLLQEFTPLWREAKSSDLFNQKMLSISILDYEEEHTLVEGWVSFLWQCIIQTTYMLLMMYWILSDTCMHLLNKTLSSTNTYILSVMPISSLPTGSIR